MVPLYYLHQNGQLIYKPGADIADMRDSDFVTAFWPIDVTSRADAWTILVEGLALGADAARVNELAAKWSCTDEDAAVYADRIGVQLAMDGDQFFATRRDFINLQESPAGFGPTALYAFADLAKKLGYTASKMWGRSFNSLVQVAIPPAQGAAA